MSATATYLSDLIDALALDVYKDARWKVAEYALVKDAVDGITAKGKTITVAYSPKLPVHFYCDVTTEFWLPFSSKGTGLAGRDIRVSHGGRVRMHEKDVYCIEVMLDFKQGTTSFEVYPAIGPAYIDLRPPTYHIDSGVLTFDQEVTLTLYSKLKTAPDTEMTFEEAHMSPNTKFELQTKMDQELRDYYLVSYNAEGIPGLSNV